VGDEEGFQKRTAAEHIQNGLGCEVPAVSCLLQSQVYEVRGSKLVDRGGVLTNEQFAKGRKILSKFTLIFPPAYFLGTYSRGVGLSLVPHLTILGKTPTELAWTCSVRDRRSSGRRDDREIWSTGMGMRLRPRASGGRPGMPKTHLHWLGRSRPY